MSYLAPRIATLDDVGTLVRHRAEMFAEMGKPRDARFAEMVSQCDGWFRTHVANGTYVGFLIAPSNEPEMVVAGGGLLHLDWPPTHGDPQPLRGYILNVFVEPAHRRRGLARMATLACLDECRKRGIRIATLHAADAARSLYERLGFALTNEMRLELSF
jgi:ribosomal protein S18 acetylase RimI-like enzyme